LVCGEKSVAYVCDVFHVNRCTVHGLDRKIVQFRDGLRAAVHLHVVFKGAQLRGAGRQNQVLHVHGVYDINRGKSFGLKRCRVDVDADDSLLASIGERRGGARNGGQLRADKKVAEIEKLLLAERFAGQADLNDRHGRSRIDDHQGWRGPGRQETQKGLRYSSGLGQSRLNIGAWLEVDLDDAMPLSDCDSMCSTSFTNVVTPRSTLEVMRCSIS